MVNDAKFQATQRKSHTNIYISAFILGCSNLQYKDSRALRIQLYLLRHFSIAVTLKFVGEHFSNCLTMGRLFFCQSNVTVMAVDTMV